MNKVIFWDFDGTLVHSNSLWSNAVYNSLIKNVPDSLAKLSDIKMHMPKGFTWYTPEKDFSKLIGDLWWNDILEKFCNMYMQFGISHDLAKEIAICVKKEILSPDNYVIYDDTHAILRKSIEKGYNNYILSNNYPELQDIIEKLGLLHYFKGCIVSAKIGYDKPRKEIFEYALKMAGNPKNCFMVGDNPVADIYGGNLVNMKTILVHSEAGCEAMYRFDDLAMIDTVL